MEWQYERQVRETVGWFVERAIPDPESGWDGFPYTIEGMGRDDGAGGSCPTTSVPR